MRTPGREMTGPTRRAVLERHVATTHARDTVAKALYEVAIEGLGYGPRDLPTSADREWIRGAIAMPIQEATELTLHDLARRLDHALERGPDGLPARFEMSHEGADIGAE